MPQTYPLLLTLFFYGWMWLGSQVEAIMPGSTWFFKWLTGACSLLSHTTVIFYLSLCQITYLSFPSWSMLCSFCAIQTFTHVSQCLLFPLLLMLWLSSEQLCNNLTLPFKNPSPCLSYWLSCLSHCYSNHLLHKVLPNGASSSSLPPSASISWNVFVKDFPLLAQLIGLPKITVCTSMSG